MGDRKLRKVIFDDSIKFDGCYIYIVRDGGITIHINAYLDDVGNIEIAPEMIKYRMYLFRRRRSCNFGLSPVRS